MHSHKSTVPDGNSIASHFPGLTWDCEDKSAFSNALIRTTPALAQEGLSLRMGLTGMITSLR